MSDAACGFYLNCCRPEEEKPIFQVEEAGGRLRIDARSKRAEIPDMCVKAPAGPVSFLDNGTKDAQYLGGVRLEDYLAGGRKEKEGRELLIRVADRILAVQDGGWETDIQHFDWVPGVGLYGLCRAWQVTGQERYLSFLLKWTKEHLQEAFDRKTVNSSAPLLTVLSLYKETGNEAYLQACVELADEITDNAPRTVDGGLEHTVTEEGAEFSDQMWADTLFMVCIFLARLGRVTGNRKYTDFAAEQLRLHHRFLRDERLGIYYHGWNGQTGDHMSGAHWARANAWVLYSTVEILREVPAFEGRDEIELFLRQQAESLMPLQRENGMFTTLLEDPESYEEISATAGIAAGIHRGVKAGLIAPECDRIFERAVNNFQSWIGSGGEVMGVSAGTPVMPDLEDYKKIPVRETLYGQGLMLLALAERPGNNES